MGGFINVPDHLRKLDEQAFTPLLISIGPIHLSNAKLQTMKMVKVYFSDCFIQRANIDLEELLGTIEENEKEIRSYYAETTLSSPEFGMMILVDGIFILEYLLRQRFPVLDRMDPIRMIAEWMPPILKFDLLLLGNQLPFSVLERLFVRAHFSPELNLSHPSLKELAFSFFQCYDFQMIGNQHLNAKIEHFTDLVRLFYLSEELPERSSGRAKLSYSATQLHEAGVKFKRVEVNGTTQFGGELRRFLDIRFNNGVLEIPCIELNDERVRLIRNIIALEQSHFIGQAYVTDFFVILDFLIDNSKDVDLLCNKGILINYLGDNNTAALAINSLNTSILWDYMNHKYSKICEDLNLFYEKPWHRWRATLWRQYFSTPWRATSTSAAIILLVLTAIQTVCSLKSTKW